jgi:hypothetical protein
MNLYPHVEADLNRYIMNIWENGFAASMEMLQFKGFRLARKHNISGSKISQVGWVKHFIASHDLTIRHQMMNRETIRSTQGNVIQFPKICPETEKAA